MPTSWQEILLSMHCCSSVASRFGEHLINGSRKLHSNYKATTHQRKGLSTQHSLDVREIYDQKTKMNATIQDQYALRKILPPGGSVNRTLFVMEKSFEKIAFLMTSIDHRSCIAYHILSSFVVLDECVQATKLPDCAENISFFLFLWVHLRLWCAECIIL